MNNKTKNIDAERTALLPCPFCGGPVNLELVKIDGTAMYGRREWWGVICRNTENLGGTCAIQQIPSASKEAAVARWNRRATPPSPSTAPIAEDERAAFDAYVKSAQSPAIEGEEWSVLDIKKAWLIWQARAALSSRPAGEVELPPLPKPKYSQMNVLGYGEVVDCCGYTADQLRAYGQECASAALASKPAAQLDAAPPLSSEQQVLQKPCKQEMIAAGAKAWPRTCPRHGLSGCPTVGEPPAEKGETNG